MGLKWVQKLDGRWTQEHEDEALHRDDDGEGDEGVAFERCYVRRETALALLVAGIGGTGRRDVWVPKSVVHDDSQVFDAGDNREGTLVVKRWFAEKEGLG